MSIKHGINNRCYLILLQTGYVIKHVIINTCHLILLQSSDVY